MSAERGGVGSLHHVTAMSGDPSETLGFYRDVLGLRLVKKTVNFDDPGTYHLYFGDNEGAPGTVMTFFPWPLARRGSRGSGQCTATQFAVPEGALDYWTHRLSSIGIASSAASRRFDEDVLEFEDPHGLLLEIVASADVEVGGGWEGSTIPPDARISGFHGVTLTQRALAPTAAVLELLGFSFSTTVSQRHRFVSSQGGNARFVDVVVEPDAPRGQVSKGTVHHVAFRVPDDTAQAHWRERLLAAGMAVSPVMDRQYFRSIYFSEPGGVLFELATDGPGFAVDEAVDMLGSELKLPAQYESRRGAIEKMLPPLDGVPR